MEIKEAVLPKWQFKYLGRRFTLRKRRGERDGAWYLQTIINGERLSISMQVNDSKVAQAKAIREIIHPRMTGQPIPEDATVAKRLKPAGVVCLREVFNVFRASTQLRLKERTVYDYIWSMREVVRKGTSQGKGAPLPYRGKQLTDAEVDGLSANVLTRELVGRFQRAMLAEAGGGELEQNSAAISANSILSQARSLFGKRALAADIYAGLKLPELVGFMNAPKLPVLKRSQYELPAREVLTRITAAAEELRVKDPALWLVFYLAMQTGLRKGELIACRWGWFSEEGVKVKFEEDFVPKGKAERFIPLGKETVGTIRAVWRELHARAKEHLCPTGEMGDQVRVLQGNTDLLFRKLGEWMGANGWDRRMKAHELRKVFASMVTKVNSVYSAQALLGHQDLKTTARYAAAPVPVAVDVAKALG